MCIRDSSTSEALPESQAQIPHGSAGDKCTVPTSLITARAGAYPGEYQIASWYVFVVRTLKSAERERFEERHKHWRMRVQWNWMIEAIAEDINGMARGERSGILENLGLPHAIEAVNRHVAMLENSYGKDDKYLYSCHAIRLKACGNCEPLEAERLLIAQRLLEFPQKTQEFFWARRTFIREVPPPKPLLVPSESNNYLEERYTRQLMSSGAPLLDETQLLIQTYKTASKDLYTGAHQGLTAKKYLLMKILSDRKHHRQVINEASTDDVIERVLRITLDCIQSPQAGERRISFVEYMLNNTYGSDDLDFLSEESLLREDEELKTKEIRRYAEFIAELPEDHLTAIWNSREWNGEDPEFGTMIPLPPAEPQPSSPSLLPPPEETRADITKMDECAQSSTNTSLTPEEATERLKSFRSVGITANEAPALFEAYQRVANTEGHSKKGTTQSLSLIHI